MPLMYWLIVVVSMVISMIYVWQLMLRERVNEHTRQLALRPEKLMRYIECLHTYGVGSLRSEDLREALKYGEDGEQDEIFLRRAEVMEDLFLMKKHIWEGH